MTATVTARRARTYRVPRPSFPAEFIPAPPDKPLIPPAERHRMAGFCTRCDRPAVVLLGGPDGLCEACEVAEAVDRSQR